MILKTITTKTALNLKKKCKNVFLYNNHVMIPTSKRMNYVYFMLMQSNKIN